MTYFNTSKSAYFMMANTRTSALRDAGFCLGNRPESARDNLCVMVRHLCGAGALAAWRRPRRRLAPAVPARPAILGLYANKPLQAPEETPASGHGRPNHPPLGPASHTVSLRH